MNRLTHSNELLLGNSAYYVRRPDRSRMKREPNNVFRLIAIGDLTGKQGIRKFGLDVRSVLRIVCGSLLVVTVVPSDLATKGDC